MPTVGVVLVAGLVLRLFHAGFVAFGDAFYVHGVDAQGFHDMAGAIVSGEGSHELREGYWYVSLLAALYAFTGAEMLAGNLLSVAVWTVTALTLDASMRELRTDPRWRAAGMTVFAFLPANLIYTSITLREGLEQLVLCVAAWSLLASPRLGLARSILLLLACCVTGGMLHRAVTVGAAAALVALLARHWRQLGAIRRTAILAVTAAGVTAGVLWNVRFAMESERSLLGEIAFHRYAAGTQLGRSNYVDAHRFDTDAGIAPSQLGEAVLQYFVEPLPWRAGSAMDAYLMMENVLRLTLMAMAVVAVSRSPWPVRVRLGAVLGMWLLLECFWAVGTTNWGTALRHHVPGLGLLVLSAFGGRRGEDRAYRVVSGDVAAA